ncbi:hypothetical protein Esti_004510 [Eimeria stiedai]
MTSLCSFVATLVETVFLSVAAAPYQGMAGDLSQLGLAGGPSQSFAFAAGVEKAPNSMSLLHASADRASVPRQTRHCVFHRALLGAATAYVAILAVALLVLACARRLSRLSVEGGRVRSLAGGDGDEAVGACGGNAERGEEEDQNYEEDKALQYAIIEQARENIDGFRGVVQQLVEMKNGASFRILSAATSVYILFLSEMGALGAFIDEELLPLRPLWLQVMEEAIQSSSELENGWRASSWGGGNPDVLEMNFQLVEYARKIKTTSRKRKIRVEGGRWKALRDLLMVQPYAAAIACRYLSAIHPGSGAERLTRRYALGRLATAADMRRTMILGSWPFSFYFGGFYSRGFARMRFGASAGYTARADNPPLNPADQISYLLELFPDAFGDRPPGTAAAMPTHSPTEGPPKHPQEPPTQPPGTAAASGPGSQGPYSSEQSGARPKLTSHAAAASGQKSSGLSPKQPFPGGPKGARPSSSAGTKMQKPSASVPGSQPQPVGTPALTWHLGARFRHRRMQERKSKQKRLVQPGKEEAPSGPREEAEEGESERQEAPVDAEAEALAAFVLLDTESSTAGVGDGATDEAQSSVGGPLHTSQTPTHHPLPEQEHGPFSSSPWAAPGTPAGPHTPGVRPSFPKPVNAFYGVPQGAPMPSTRMPFLPPGFSGPLSFSGPVGQILQGPLGPSGLFPGAPPMSPFLSPYVPPGFTGPPQFDGAAQHTLLRPAGPLPPTSEHPFFGPFLGSLQQPAVMSPLPFPHSGPLPPPPSGATGPSSLGLSSPTVPKPHSSRDRKKSKSRLSGVYVGAPVGEPAPSATSLLGSLIMGDGNQEL